MFSKRIDNENVRPCMGVRPHLVYKYKFRALHINKIFVRHASISMLAPRLLLSAIRHKYHATK